MDELFLTLAPKLQGGSNVPTLLEGRAYPPEGLPLLELLSLYSEGSELYRAIAYRRRPTVDPPALCYTSPRSGA